MATRRSWDHMSRWASQPVPTPGSPWPGRPLGGGFATTLMQAQGGIFKGTVKASRLATLSQPCPHHRQRTQVVDAGTEVASCPGPTFPLDPNGGISQALPWGARASPSCPGCIWRPLASTRRTFCCSQTGSRLSCQCSPCPATSPQHSLLPGSVEACASHAHGLGTRGQDGTNPQAPNVPGTY